MELAAKGLGEEATAAALRDWFNLAHEWIVRGFADLTTKGSTRNYMETREMTEEVRQQSFARYLAAKNAVVAYGLSETFDDEQSFTTGPTSSAAWVTNLTVDPKIHIQAVPVDYPRVFTMVLGTLNTAKASGSLGKMEIIPPALVASGALAARLTILHGGSMATQQPSVEDDESVEETIRRLQTTIPLSYRVRLISRLRELQKAVQEEESDDRGISVGSLQYFLRFLGAHRTLRCPAISITPDRNIYASWKSGSSQLFSIHFLPEGTVRFVIFCPNNKHPGQTIRLSGTATVDVIIDIAAPHGVLEWMQNERPSHTRF